MPNTTQPWCSSGTVIVSSVDSWPPCIVEVEVNTAAGLPTSVPLAHCAPRPSMKCLTGAAMLPKRVGLPRTRPAHSSRSAGCTIRGDATVRLAMPEAETATEADWETEYLAPIIAEIGRAAGRERGWQ